MQRKRYNAKKGFTLIEGLVLLFIFSVASLAFYQTFILSTQAIIDAKLRLIAVNFTNEEIEILRNTPYNDLFVDPATNPPTGTVAVDPDEGDDYSGISFIRDVDVNNTTLHVFTEIEYVDDEQDGTDGGAPDDTAPQDYKEITITALWGSDTSTPFAGVASASKKVKLSSYFIPPNGLETAIDGGILSVNVFDSAGVSIDASVEVYDLVSNASEGTQATGTDGNTLFSGIDAGESRYRITVSTSGYETIRTLDTTSDLIPLFPHQTIIDGTITTANIFTELAQDFTLHTKNVYCDALDNINFDLEGGRVIGTDPSNGNADVFVYYGTGLSTDGSAQFVVRTDTDADGDVDSNDTASAGSYTLTLQETDYTLLYLDPSEVEVPQRITIPHDPGTSSTNTDCNVIIADDAFDSIFVRVIDTSTNTPIEGAKVIIGIVAIGFTSEQKTDQYGYAYFPHNKIELLTNGAVYDVSVTADGFGNYNSTVTVDGLKIEAADLTPL